MKKNTKGAIAVGAAALLLAGGAGTMAAWSDEASLDGDTVTSGQLLIDAVEGTGNWTWADGEDFDPTEDRIVPGDSVTYTSEYDLTVVGNNLQASITADIDGIDVSGELSEYLTEPATEVTLDGDELGVITEDNNDDTVTVATTITFNPNTSGTDGMNESANLSGATITLQQTAPAPGTP